MTPSLAPALIDVGVPGVEIEQGDHICAFYPTQLDRNEILMGYLMTGIEADNRCVAVLDSHDLVEFEADLALTTAAAPPSPGQVTLLDERQTYLAEGGLFSAPRMCHFLESSVKAAMADGFGLTRLVGELTWAADQLACVEELLHYEAQLNRCLHDYPQVTLCLYQLDLFDGEVLVNVLRTHPKVLLGGMLLNNPYYTDPEELLATRED